MASLVEQLQAEAIDQSVSVATLLRKVKLIAGKLGLADTVAWVDNELTGHKEAPVDVPSYRKVSGQVRAYSRYHGWQPPAGDSKIINALSQRQMGDAISALEDLVRSDSSGTLVMEIAPDIKAKLLTYGWTDIHVEIPRGAVVAVVDHVRNMVLDWAMDLEAKGITGEGVSFTPSERERAVAAHINIQNFQGNLHAGDVSGINSRVNQGGTDSSMNVVNADKIFQEVSTAVSAGVDDPEARQELLNAIAEMKAAKGTSKFIHFYQRFVGLAADHLSILGPFLPALASLA